MNAWLGPGPVGRPDPARRRRAQRLIERFHAGLIDAEVYVQGLQQLFQEEFAQELSVEPAGPAAPPGPSPDAGDGDQRDEDEAIRRLFPTRDDAPGLWLVLGQDRCHYCGRTLPVLALKADDEDGGWVHLCLDDLDLIRSQAEAALRPR